MNRKTLVCFSLLFLILSAAVFAQDDDLQSAVDYKVNKMKTVLHLTDSQSDTIRPIIKDYLAKRSAILQEVAVQGLLDHKATRSTLKGLKEIELQKLGMILTPDQMKKWIDKENLMAALNPDSAENSSDDGPTLNGEGVDLKF